MAKGPRHRRPYPKEPKREMTDAWKLEVLASLERKGISLPQAAIRIDVDRKTVWQALKTSQQTSSIVGALSDLAGVDPPLVEAKGDDLDRIVASIRSESDRRRAAEMLRLMLGVRDSLDDR